MVTIRYIAQRYQYAPLTPAVELTHAAANAVFAAFQAAERSLISIKLPTSR